MRSNYRGKLVPIKNLKDGVWLKPESARHYFRNGRGIALGTLKNKIGNKELLGKVKWDHTGCYVWISNEAINNKMQLEAA